MQDAIDEFAIDVDGFPKEERLNIAAKFDTETNYAIRITIAGGSNPMVATDVAITGTAREGTTGTIVAADFQTTLQAATGGSETVTWSNFYFTVDTLDATSITYGAPSDVTKVDARALLGLNGTPTLSDFSHDGNFPQDCTMEATIPSDAITINRVEWDKNKIYELPQEYFVSPEAAGDPQFYAIRGRNIQLLPSPLRQELFVAQYKGLPAATIFAGYQECGLSGISDESATGLSAVAYYYKIAINDSAITEYTITVGADKTYSAVITLMNAQNTGATFSIVAGDLRCTSDAVSGVSSISLSAGTTGTDLFATLTGWTAFDTAVDSDTNLPTDIPAQYHQYVPRLVASKLLDETHEYKDSQYQYAKYARGMHKYKSNYANKNTTVMVGGAIQRLPRVRI
jgi:hypothetical protein